VGSKGEGETKTRVLFLGKLVVRITFGGGWGHPLKWQRERGRGERHQRARRKSVTKERGRMKRVTLMKKGGEVKGADEEGVVGEVDGEGLEGGGCKGVGLGLRRGREERREEQRAKCFGLTNGSRVWGFWRTRKVFSVKDKIVRKGGANGKRRRVGLWRRTRKVFIVIGKIVRKRGANGKRRRVGLWRSLGAKMKRSERRERIG
jgi:hypothetical protein